MVITFFFLMHLSRILILIGIILLSTNKIYAKEFSSSKQHICKEIDNTYHNDIAEYSRAQVRSFRRHGFRCPEFKKQHVPEIKKQQRILTHYFDSPIQGKSWRSLSYEFGKRYSYARESGEMRDWGLHLGEDVDLAPGTPIVATGRGEVVYSAYHMGENKDKRNWGGIVILAHWISQDRAMYSLYGHLELHPDLKKGDILRKGDVLGWIAPPLTPENGWWEEAHLHFQMNIDPKDAYRGGVLAGYDKNRDAPNRIQDHVRPMDVFRAEKPLEFLLQEEENWRRKR